MEDREKLYKIKFIQYTNTFKDTVRSEELDKYEDAKDLIIRESDIDYYRQFGEGISELEFVGYLGEKEE